MNLYLVTILTLEQPLPFLVQLCGFFGSITLLKTQQAPYLLGSIQCVFANTTDSCIVHFVQLFNFVQFFILFINNIVHF